MEEEEQRGIAEELGHRVVEEPQHENLEAMYGLRASKPYCMECKNVQDFWQHLGFKVGLLLSRLEIQEWALWDEGPGPWEV